MQREFSTLCVARIGLGYAAELCHVGLMNTSATAFVGVKVRT